MSKDSADLGFSPATLEQAEAMRLWKESDILFLTGEAGSGKTHLGLYLALREVLEKRAERIVLSRPMVPCDGEQIGFLPGKLEQKVRPWLLPIEDVLKRMSNLKAEEFFKQYVEIAPLGFMRGRTFNRCIALLDEAQNCTLSQLSLFLTRLGQKAKLIVCGDPMQSDRLDTGLSDCLYRLGFNRQMLHVDSLPPAGINHVSLTSVNNPRHPLIPEILSRLQG